MAVTVTDVEKGSPAQMAGILPGDELIAVNSNEIEDVLDYRFYIVNRRLDLTLMRSGKKKVVKIKKDEYDDIGLGFETYLMDNQHSCRNKCVFCFIDQLPKGLRKSLYFKDDDSRLSFLFGNYITLTNLTEHEAQRIIKMHISPINISVHTTDPELRCRMMNNRFAGEALGYLYRFAENGIKINCQLVLCPGYNDGEALEKTMNDLKALYPSVQSVAAVPVGLSKHREGLEKIEPFNEETAAKVIDSMTRVGDECLEKFGTRIFYPADEFFLLASKDMPDCDFYGDFSQIENGVGMYALTRSQFYEELENIPGDQKEHRLTIATGRIAEGLMNELIGAAKKKFPGLDCDVIAIRNDLFGERITVTGLVTGGDIISQLSGRVIKGGRLVISDSMLDRDGKMFLDDTTPEDIEKALNVQLITTGDSAELLHILSE